MSVQDTSDVALARIDTVAVPGNPSRTYFHEPGGQVWRVYDRSFGLPHAKPNRHCTWDIVGDPRATMRWFQGRGGSSRHYRFTSGEDRVASVATLGRQLGMATPHEGAARRPDVDYVSWKRLQATRVRKSRAGRPRRTH